MKQRDVLEVVAWAEKHFGSLTTTRECSHRDVLSAVQAGLVKSIGMVTLCDGDGCTLNPERYREGFVLTDAGRDMLAAPAEVSSHAL